jgi:hypothetical protein
VPCFVGTYSVSSNASSSATCVSCSTGKYSAALGAANGDMRQALDRLYDRFERGRLRMPH